jgi:hypothetical protein
MVIDLTYDSVMDMVRPEVRPGIKVHHNLQVTVSGHNALSENRNRSAGAYSDRNAMMQVLGSTGDDLSYASWQVAADGRLVRTQNDPTKHTDDDRHFPARKPLPPRRLRPTQAGLQGIRFPAHLDPYARLLFDLRRDQHNLHDPLINWVAIDGVAEVLDALSLPICVASSST